MNNGDLKYYKERKYKGKMQIAKTTKITKVGRTSL